MKKFSLPILIAFFTGDNDRLKAWKISFLVFLFCCISNIGFAQVSIIPAFGGGQICTPFTGCTALSTITITETNNGDFAGPGTDQITLVPPAGWQFCASPCPTFSVTVIGDVTAVNGAGCSATGMTLNIITSGTSAHDQITITGLQIEPLTNGALPGSITASSVTGVFNIIPNSTDFGDLGLYPGVISGNTIICAGDHTTLSDQATGGVWTSATTTVATIDPSTGFVQSVGGIHAPGGTTQITYSVTGCSASTVVTVNPNPPQIVGIKDICQNSTYTISDAAQGGLFSTGGPVTITNDIYNPLLPPYFGLNGRGVLTGINPGLSIIIYTLPTGCFVDTFMTTNPLPGPIISTDNYQVCAGSTITLSDATAGGTWSSSLTTVATIDVTSGVLLGVGSGPGVVTRITYTLAGTGCSVDTPVTVNPLPGTITGASHTLCVNSTLSLSDATGGGSWSSSNTTFATVVTTGTAAGTVTGVGAGIVYITYTLPTSCYTTYSITVNPIPDPITGPNAVCQSDSITLNEALPGGTWSSSNNAIATVGSTGVVVGLLTFSTTSNIDTILYTFGTGCNAIYPITINPLPAGITGNTDLCQMQCTNLSDATPGGGWTTCCPLSVTVDPVTGQVCGIQVGTSFITYTLPTGCYRDTTVNVNPLSPIFGPTSVCEGLTITLNNATPGGGIWASSNPAAATINSTTGVVTGVSSLVGRTVISFITPTSCTATYTVTVNPSPAAITGTDSVCAGSTTNLSDATTGGIWSSSNPFIASVGSITGVVTGFPTGQTPQVVFITYTLPAGCFSTYSLTVNPLPSAILGPNSVCQGYSVTLSDSLSGGTWTSSNTTIATINSTTGVVTGVPTPGTLGGTVTITYTLPTGCTRTSLFTVHPLDGITGSTVVCAGSRITLSDGTPGGAGVWTVTGPATITPSTGVLTGVQPGGIATVTYTTPAGCAATYTVLVNPMPDSIRGPSSVCVGQFITLSDATAGGTWSSSQITIATIGSSSGIVGGVRAGTDSITYTIGTGCIITRTITVNPLSRIIGLPGAVCVNSTLNLSDATAGGTWSSSTSSIATIVGTGSTAGVVTGVTPGIDTIYYTITATGCTYKDTVRVNPLPTAIIGLYDSVCVASTIHLSDATPGGLWSSTPTLIATVVLTGSTGGTVTGVSAGMGHITYTLPTGCKVSDSVKVNPLPAPIIGPADSSVCILSSITLSDATPGGTWSSSNTSLAVIGSTGVVTTGTNINDTGSFIITYMLPTGCDITAKFYVRPLPVITVTHPNIMCKGASELLIASGAGVAGTYSWAPPGGLSIVTADGDSAIAHPLVTTTYTVTATTRYGCKADSTTIVWVDSALNHLAVIGKDSICEGEKDTLRITGGVDSIYYWTPPTGLNTQNDSVVVTSTTSTITYEAHAWDFMGCEDSVAFTVTVNPLPVLSVSPNPVIVCKRTPTEVVVTGAGPGGTYLWSPNQFISCNTCDDVFLSDTSNFTYNILGTTVYGCKDSLLIRVSVLDTNVNTISNDTIICIGDTARIIATSQSLTSNLDVPTYIWTPAAGLSDPRSQDPYAYPTVTTVYTVVITENFCFKDTEHVQVTVEPLPQIIITPPSATVIAGTAVQLSASAPNVIVSSYAWSPGATLSCDSCMNPIATPVAQSTTYTVTAVSNFGCLQYSTVTINLYCDNSQIFIPNSFTPNGDGVNDRFFISGKGIGIINRFAVYNRWGQLLYEVSNVNINDAGAGWDGTYKGLVLEPDVFIYEITGTCELGQQFNYKGDVSIVR